VRAAEGTATLAADWVRAWVREHEIDPVGADELLAVVMAMIAGGWDSGFRAGVAASAEVAERATAIYKVHIVPSIRALEPPR
jgi:hypothetical protein